MLYLQHCTPLTWLVSVAFCATAPLMAVVAKMKVWEISGIILMLQLKICLLLTFLNSDSIKENQSEGPAFICPKTWDRFTIGPLLNCIKSWGERTPDGAQMFCFNCISPSGGLLFDKSQSNTLASLYIFLLRIMPK